ncbi:MAG: DUF6175 family protein [Spirosomataceae bacterium]
MKKYFLMVIACLGLLRVACAQQGTRSRLMIIPADDLLKRLKCYNEKVVQGQKVAERDYLKAYSDLIELRFVNAAIAQKFVDAGFPPLEDLEQALKNITDEGIQNDIRGVQTDAITQVLNNVRPDVILELSYQLQQGAVSNRLTFLLVAKDPYTTKVIATISNPGSQTTETDVPTMLAEQVENNLKNFTDALNRHGADVQANGRTLRLSVLVDGNADFDLEDDCGSTGKAFIDVITDVVEVHKKKESETPNPGTPTGKRVQISNIRIDYIDPVKKRGLSARDWTNYVIKDIQKTCGVKAKNISQGLGDARMILSR